MKLFTTKLLTLKVRPKLRTSKKHMKEFYVKLYYEVWGERYEEEFHLLAKFENSAKNKAYKSLNQIEKRRPIIIWSVVTKRI